MMLGDLLYARLTADSAVSTLVDDRVYPLHLPQSPTLPALTYQVISRVPTEANTEIFEVRIQFDCWSSNYDQAQTLAVAIKRSLRFYRQADNDDNMILSIYDANQSDGYEDEQEIWRVIVDVIAIVYES